MFANPRRKSSRFVEFSFLPFTDEKLLIKICAKDVFFPLKQGLMCLRFSRDFASEERQDTFATTGFNLTQKSPSTSPIVSTSLDSLHATEKKASLSENSDKAFYEDSCINQSNMNFQEVRDGDETFSKAVVPRRKGETKFYHKDLAFLSVLVPVKWVGTSAALLLRKASSVYHSFAFASVSKGKYGRALRYCKMALKCFGSYKSLTVDCEGAKDSLLSSILCSCGDAYLMLAKCKENLAVHQEDYKFKSKDDTFIAEFARQHRGELYEVCALRIEFVLELEGNLSKRWVIVINHAWANLCLYKPTHCLTRILHSDWLLY